MDDIRNIGIIAHIDAGKTTTTENLLYLMGHIHSVGNVDEGNTTTDWMEQEQERGITITAACVTSVWKDTRINLIDTPGHIDFVAEVERSLRVLDGAVAIFSAVDGVEPQSETVWSQAKNHQISRIIFINKMDRVGANLEYCLESIQNKLGEKALVMQYPIGQEKNFQGMIDLITMKKWIYDQGQAENVPLDEQEQLFAQRARNELIDQLSLISDEITELYLNNEPISEQLLRKTIREKTIKGQIFPLFIGSSLKEMGLDFLLQAIQLYLPCPSDKRDFQALDQNNHICHLTSNDHSAALIFKNQMYGQQGLCSFVRVYSGSIVKSQQYYNPRTKKKHRIMRLIRLHADRFENINQLQSGDIGAIVGSKDWQTGDTLIDQDYPYILEGIGFPDPVISLKIEAHSSDQEAKLMDVLQLIALEDPTFLYHNDKQTGELLISGMGELHLDVVLNRLKQEFQLQVKAGKPQVSYKETIREKVQHHQIVDQNLNEKPVFFGITLTLEPLDQGEPNQVLWNIPETQKYPKWLAEKVIETLQESLVSGLILGYPVVQMKVSVEKVEFDEQKSTQQAVLMACYRGFAQAFNLAAPELLEPVMQVQLTCPSEFVGSVLQQLSLKGASIEQTNNFGSTEQIKAYLKLSQLFGYSTELRSLTQGRAYFVMSFSHYDQATQT